jgi:hypothetical protein
MIWVGRVAVGHGLMASPLVLVVFREKVEFDHIAIIWTPDQVIERRAYISNNAQILIIVSV